MTSPQITFPNHQNQVFQETKKNDLLKSKDKYENIPKPYLEIAEGMESQFINYMLTELEKTVPKEKEDSQAEAYYKSLLNNERAEIMAKTENGIGLKDMVLDQIYPKYMRRPIAQKNALDAYQNISMNDRENIEGDTHE